MLKQKLKWVREEVVNECRQECKSKKYQLPRNFTTYKACFQRVMVDTLRFRWRFNIRRMLSIAYINQTYTIHLVYHFSRTRGWRLTRFLQICKMYFSVLVAILSQPSVPGHAKTSQISSEDQWCTANCGGDVGKSKHCDAQSFKQHRRSALLFFKVISQISRSHGTQKLPILIRIERFRTVTPVWIDWWLWNVTQSLKNHISSIMIR